jgi:hypothetical protein
MEEKYKIHAFYILAILVSIIVILVTIKWSDIPNLAEKLSFALTLASLILAVFAIVYAVYSNTSFSQAVSTLHTVATEVSHTAKQISAAANELDRDIKVIPSRLEVMEVKVGETNDLIQKISESGEAKPASENVKTAVTELVGSFVENSPPAGLLILYAYCLAYTQRKIFNVEELISTLTTVDIYLARGFIMASKASGFITSTHNEYLVTVTYVNEKLEHYLTNELDTHFRNLPNTFNLDGDIFREAKESNLKDKQLIEAYFNERPFVERQVYSGVVAS